MICTNAWHSYTYRFNQKYIELLKHVPTYIFFRTRWPVFQAMNNFQVF
ncbi:hypothetical protein GCM10010303_86360 [Streptomyces purpurascens]|nr:hypothetical protein GCM10010303_86360 [Streptomyces purpurascens]